MGKLIIVVVLGALAAASVVVAAPADRSTTASPPKAVAIDKNKNDKGARASQDKARTDKPDPSQKSGYRFQMTPGQPPQDNSWQWTAEKSGKKKKTNCATSTTPC